MKAPIIEVFSSFQGEGLLIGERQIFVRFAGCNLNCSYCDTEYSRDENEGQLLESSEVVSMIRKLITPDCKSISFTGGEPSLYPEFINEVSLHFDLKIMLETNGTLPDKIDLIEKLDIVSLDIKLSEHFSGVFDKSIFLNEIKSLNLLITKSINVYCKVVILPSTKIKSFKEVIQKLSENVSHKKNITIIIQPSSPLEEWKNIASRLFDFSQIVGEYFDVLTIPQIHKILEIE